MTQPGSERRGDADRWIVEVYDALRGIAGRALRRERASATLQPTLLVHEAYLRLAKSREGLDEDHAGPFPDRERFLAAASKALQEVLIDHARRRDARKRGGSWRRVTMSHPQLLADEPLDLFDFVDALAALDHDHQRAAHVVRLRVLSGFTVSETARALSVSPRTVDLDWRFARAWLDDRLRPEDDE